MNRKTLIKTILLLLLIPVLLIVILCLSGMWIPMGFLALLGLASAEDDQADRLIFRNESSAEVALIELEQNGSSQTFSLDGKETIIIEWGDWPCTLTASDAEGREVACLSITEDPQVDMARDEWHVIAQDSPEGTVLTLSHNSDLKKILKWGKKNSGLDLSGGTIRTFIYRHGWMGDGDSLLVMTFSPEQGAELEKAMTKTNGWHSFPTPELINKIFFQKSSYCRDWNGENYLPAVQDGWYFFRDTFNVQHGEHDANQWNLEGRSHLPGNFDAGIYDSDTLTLYLFEFDS